MSQANRATRPSPSDRLRVIEAAASLLQSGNLLHRIAEDDRLDGRSITLDGRRLVNFGSCSYLGLETDTRLKAAACEAVLRYGTQFSSSRTYISAPLYREFQEVVSAMVGGLPVVIAPTTSLGHLAALPVLVNERDAVLYDVNVHNSVQTLLPTLQQDGIHCEPVSHNRLDRMEERAHELARQHERIFYLCDGVYSMQGDTVDATQLFGVLNRNPKLWAYVDDAHGVGWTGRNGAGVVLGKTGIHERMVVTLGWAKAGASAGAALVFPNAELARSVASCGSTMIFSGPMQPAQLGASIASARIFLSPEVSALQQDVETRMALFDAQATREGLSVRALGASPIRFIESGSEEGAIALASGLQAAGYFVNAAICPAVPRGRAGIRMMLTRQQTLEDVRGLVREIAVRLHGRPRTPSMRAPSFDRPHA
ncbi:MAG: aminotransferase class I/II-fold pyridoxal phosphate-dependent enzyme [Myxococcota bacterium]